MRPSPIIPSCIGVSVAIVGSSRLALARALAVSCCAVTPELDPMGTDAGAGRGTRRRRVVIVGGGFGGLTAAPELRGAEVDVTLVDPTSHHLFQPLLYQLACGGLSPASAPRRSARRCKRSANTTVLMASAIGLDVERRQVMLDRGERLDYDSLIVACGAETSYFGKDEWRDVSCSLKTLDDAVELRNRLYGALRGGRARERPARARAVADVRRDRRRPDGSRARRRAGDHRQAHDEGLLQRGSSRRRRR